MDIINLKVAENIDKRMITCYIRKWLKIPRSGNILHIRLGSTNLVCHFKGHQT